MSGVYLESLRMRRESKSFVDCLYAVLTHAGLFDGPKYRLSGLTGMAFKLSVHERLLPLSVSAYGNWVAEHDPAADNVGCLTIGDAGRTRHPTFRRYRQQAIDSIKRSLDRGVGAIYWLPEFGVIHGYDDEDGVFFMQDGWSREEHIVLYDNFGLNDTGFWYVCLVEDRMDVPIDTMVLESARLAVNDWDTPFKTLPGRDIASGKLAYAFWVRALTSGDYDAAGARYIFDSYRHAREEIRSYLDEVRTLAPELESAYRLYEEIAGGAARADAEEARTLAAKLGEWAALEDRAMTALRAWTARYPDPWSRLVPRWGTSTPR